MKTIPVFLVFLFFISCSEFASDKDGNALKGKVRDLPKNMSYSYDCLKDDSSKVSDMWGKADNLINKVVTYDIEVTDEEQTKYGDTFLIESKKDKKFIIDDQDPVNEKLQTILKELLQERAKPTGIEYQIFLLKDTATINAYTVGGKIFITTAMLNKCKNDDQLYAIIGHEIGHNEKGHIKASLKQLKASREFFGEWGEALMSIKKLLTGSFNQKNEMEADYYGLDLSWKLGYDVCAIKSFWDDLAKGEKKEEWFDFFRTHPYSDTRSKCLTAHIEKNFEVECK
ncbi:MAG: M48 family metalloprotease [Rhizobacter sp.]|nr:M48 family metalloprotease [Ferruginibacter sp.]